MVFSWSDQQLRGWFWLREREIWREGALAVRGGLQGRARVCNAWLFGTYTVSATREGWHAECGAATVWLNGNDSSWRQSRQQLPSNHSARSAPG